MQSPAEADAAHRRGQRDLRQQGVIDFRDAVQHHLLQGRQGAAEMNEMCGVT